MYRYRFVDTLENLSTQANTNDAHFKWLEHCMTEVNKMIAKCDCPGIWQALQAQMRLCFRRSKKRMHICTHTFKSH